MSNVLAKENRENIRYTEFENNQVLTADQLNDLFRYLDIQTRLTRTRGIGVGIICGLEIGLTDEHAMVVSKGTAITTDGDLLHLNSDHTFDQFLAFEDTNAKYDYLHLDNGNQVPLFELVNSKTTRTQGKSVADFEQINNKALKDYVGIFYQEDYNNDTDLCTGTDCDNKGIECVRDVKVLLAHKDDVAELLKSIPKINQKYFALDDIDVPRVMIKNSISKFEELKGAFSTALTIKESLKAKLQKAYEVCKTVVEDDLGDDPVKDWNEKLDKHFELQGGIYAQYLYDFTRDLSYAYNEMRETLFNDNALCCPPIELFPKHVLMGLVKTAVVKKPVVLAAPAVTLTAVAQPRIPIFNFASTIKFNLGELIKRFHAVHIDIEYRHQFYESPVLNNKEENTERTRFCFKRMDAMISNFKVPTAEELQTVAGIKITPSQFEDRLLGERSIPFYYKYDKTQAINAYWSFEVNVRKKENDLYYYFSKEYSTAPIVRDPLAFNLLPYSFFRIEGHIGYKYQEVERMLNKIIDENNLPINLMTVQIEKEARTIPTKPWWFPHLHIYDHFVRNTFLDHLNQVDLVHTNLKKEIENDPDIGKIGLAMNNFTNVKTRMVAHKPATTIGFDAVKFKTDVADMITATTEIKANTQKFTFSNAAAPHDFIINTDILHKTDLLADLLDKHITKKKEELMLGNFMRKNPGLEHAGGVLRGGTFVLVYTSNDDKVVADFMLPYASVDKDVVPEPPVIKPLPLPDFPKFQIPKVFEKIPLYKKIIDDKALDVNERIKLFDDKVKDVNVRMDQRLGDIEVTRKLFDDNVKLFDNKIKTVDAVYTGKLNEFENKLDYQGKIFSSIANVIPTKSVTKPAGTGVIVGGVNLVEHADTITSLTREIDTLQPNTPERIAKENQLAETTRKITEAVNAPGATVSKEDEQVVKSILFDAHAATDKIVSTNNQAVRNNAAGNIRNTGIVLNRIIR